MVNPLVVKLLKVQQNFYSCDCMQRLCHLTSPHHLPFTRDMIIVCTYLCMELVALYCLGKTNYVSLFIAAFPGPVQLSVA